MAKHGVKTAAPAGALIAIIIAILGPHAHALGGAQIAQYVAAVLAGITAAVHQDAIKRATHRARRRRHHRPPSAARFTVVWDSVTITALGRLASSSTDAIVAYDDGAYNNVEQVRRDYPDHRHFTICVSAGDDGNFLDVENGDATPDQAAGWLRRQAAARAIPEAEILRRLVAWVADWTDTPHIPFGYQGCQWTSHALGRNLDESLFYTRALEGDPFGLYADASTWPAVFTALKDAGL